MAKSKWQRKQIRASLLEIVEMFNATYGPPDPKVVDAINMSASKVKKGGKSIRVQHGSEHQTNRYSSAAQLRRTAARFFKATSNLVSASQKP